MSGINRETQILAEGVVFSFGRLGSVRVVGAEQSVTAVRKSLCIACGDRAKPVGYKREGGTVTMTCEAKIDRLCTESGVLDTRPVQSDQTRTGKQIDVDFAGALIIRSGFNGGDKGRCA